jgi:hypothetical protein
MIELARVTAPLARFETRSLGDPLPACEAVTAIGEVLNYAGIDAVRSFLSQTTARVLVFDVAEPGSYPPRQEIRLGGDDWSVLVIHESEGRTLTRRILTFRLIDGDVVRSEEVHRLELIERKAILDWGRGRNLAMRPL